MEEHNDFIPENESKFSGLPVNEDSLKEIKKKYPRQIKPTHQQNGGTGIIYLLK